MTSQSGKTPKYTIVYFGVAKKFNLGPLDILIMSYIYGLSHQGPRGCYAAQKTMGELMGATETTINQHIKELEMADLITKIDYGSGKKLEYKTTEMWNICVQEEKQILDSVRRVRYATK